MPPRWMSQITQANPPGALARNSSALENCRAMNPAAHICRPSALHTEASSSMTAICFLLFGIAFIHSWPRVIRSRARGRIARIGQVLVCICHPGRRFRMARGKQQGITWAPSAMGLMSRLTYARLKKEGVVLRSVLSRSRLSLDQLENPRARISSGAQIAFLNLAAELLEDDMLGFNLAMDFELREAGLIYYVIASAQNL